MIPRYIIVHNSATADSGTASWEAIRRYHIEDRGWNDIGYHYGIEEYEGNLVFLRGRPPLTMGAHCRAGGRNRDSLGLCVVGEYDETPPDQERYGFTVTVLAGLCFTFAIPPSRVYGHREFESAKTCPGIQWDLDRLRHDIKVVIKHAPGLGEYLGS
jgi:N-acetylmuramoyl-L-alanine amidase